MDVSLNTALYKSQGIDISNVENVAKKILSNSGKEVTVQAIDYSKFNRANLGIDLYSSRTNSQLQKQIAMTQAGLYAQSINVSSLNSQAAINLYSASQIQKNVSQMQSAANIDLTPVIAIENNKNTIELLNISEKNSNSSNGFNPFAASEEVTTRDEKQEN